MARARKTIFPWSSGLPTGMCASFLPETPRDARLAELLDEGGLRSDVLKAPHHGRYGEMSAAFFQAVSPEYAVITSAEDDLEDPETVRALEMTGARVLLTREGTVELISDGQRVWLAEQSAAR